MTTKQRLSWLLFKWATKLSPGKELLTVVSEAVNKPEGGLLYIKPLDLLVDSESNIYIPSKKKSRLLTLAYQKSKGDKKSLVLILWGKLLRRRNDKT